MTTKTIRTPFYFHINTDTKDGLNKIAKFRHTSMASLIEEGSRYIIHRESERMRQDLADLEDVNGMVTH